MGPLYRPAGSNATPHTRPRKTRWEEVEEVADLEEVDPRWIGAEERKLGDRTIAVAKDARVTMTMEKKRTKSEEMKHRAQKKAEEEEEKRAKVEGWKCRIAGCDLKFADKGKRERYLVDPF